MKPAWWISAVCALVANPGFAQGELPLSGERAGEAIEAIKAVVPVKSPARRAHVYRLDECLRLAELNYPKVHEARARQKKKEHRLFEAKTAPYSEFSMRAGVGLAPTVRGTAVYSPNSDVALTSSMALAWQFGIEGLVPLWTFGKIENLWDAAEADLKASEHEVWKEKNDVRLSVRKAYYGAQLARDSLALLREAMRRIDKYMGRLEERVREGEGDDLELLKLRMYRAELDAREVEATGMESVALSGLKFLIGAPGRVEIPEEPLSVLTQPLAPLAHYLSAARLYRPEINMARAGVIARKAQLRLAKAKYYPDIGLGLAATWVRATEVADQRNPFARDAGNYASYGGGLVLRWKLGFVPESARVAQAEAELEEMRATERFALGGVGAEVERAFFEAKSAFKRMDAYKRAASHAKQWLIRVQQGIEIGTMDDEDVVDPAKEWALRRFSEMSATYDYNVAMAKLAQATGRDSDARAR